MIISRMMKLSSLALAAMLSTSVVAADNPAWQCKDTRDDYVFKFNGADAETTGHHPQYGRIVEVTTVDGKKILITEFQMQSIYRCEKVSKTPWTSS